MFNILNQVDDKKEDRSHQDNFYSKSSYNNNFQYCTHCGKYERFEYDRCVKCKGN